MPKRTSRAIMADGFYEIDARLVSIEQMLADIRRIIIDLADGQNEHRARVRDQLDRLGTRVLTLEQLVRQSGGQ